MDGIFINYRRYDSAPYAGRLYDHLRRSFPDHKVFMDIDAIDPGEDFVDAINRTLESSRVVLAVIGRSWSAAADENGKRRLDNPDDFVVRERSSALASKPRVIPGLVGGAAIRKLLDPEGEHDWDKDAQRDSGDGAAVMKASARDAMTTFKTVLWVGFGLGVLYILADAVGKPQSELVGYLAFDVVEIGFSAWFNVMLVRGRRWARIAYLAMMGLAFPSIAILANTQPLGQTMLGVVQIALGLWALKMMFSLPLNTLYMKR